MADYPLLIFPEPARADRARRFSGGDKFRPPDARQQAERLASQFQRLQQAIERQRLALQNNPLGLQPEQALVLETIGPIERFINAVKNIEGLEWLGEFELDDISPDYGFEDEKDPQKPLKGQLFLVMTDQRALQELQSLFSNWQQDSVHEQLRSYLNRPQLLYLRTGIAAIIKIRFLPGEMSPAQDFTIWTIKFLPAARCVEPHRAKHGRNATSSDI